MKYVSAMILVTMLAIPKNAFAEYRNSGEALMGLAAQWASQPQPTTKLHFYQPPQAQHIPDARANQGLSYQERVILNQMMQRGQNGNTYNNYFSDDDE